MRARKEEEREKSDKIEGEKLICWPIYLHHRYQTSSVIYCVTRPLLTT